MWKTLKRAINIKTTKVRITRTNGDNSHKDKVINGIAIRYKVIRVKTIITVTTILIIKFSSIYFFVRADI